MNEVIETFINLPGVVTVALIHGKAPPYFYNKAPAIDVLQKQMISQKILDSMAKAPEELDFMEFQVMDYYVYTYKLASNIIVLALSTNNSAAIKLLAGKKLKTALQENIEQTLESFKIPISKFYNQTLTTSVNTKILTTTGNSEMNSSENLVASISIEELLKIMNKISKFSSNYMGAKLISNYWDLSRPKNECLDSFQINRSAEITFSGVVTEWATSAQYRAIKEWVAAFMKQCSLIMQDLPSLIEEKCLDEEKKKLILMPAKV